MPRVILQPEQFKRLLRRRRAMGGDLYDEVWDGVYVMSPLADNQHQKIGLDLATAFKMADLGEPEVQIFHGTNVSDRREGWRKNYRCPDVAVFLPGNPAEDRGTHWLGGPDFAVEILSPRDRSRKKFDFYAKVGVRELLFVERQPWRLELYRRDAEGWALAGTSSAETSESLASRVLPLTFRLLPGKPRPQIAVARADGARTWTI